MSKRIAKKSQPSYAEMENRINVITSAIVDGFGRNDILHQKEVKAWGVSSRTIDNYIREARKKIIDDTTDERKSIIGTSIRRFERIFQKSLASGNYKEANNAIMNICKLTGSISDTINFQQNNFVNNQNGISGNAISKSTELIELASELSLRLSNSEVVTDITNAIPD